ncbi:hypothetical protein SESBI_16990 [Sesbania bispinosa]|nr:hypothetical protein SESBI_16990 [Sesbania bispinosa]
MKRNQLLPEVEHRPFTPEEENTIIRAHVRFDNKLIARSGTVIPGTPLIKTASSNNQFGSAAAPSTPIPLLFTSSPYLPPSFLDNQRFQMPSPFPSTH